MLFRFGIMMILALPWHVGCASWQQGETTFQLPAPRVPSDGVTCEVAFVQWDTHSTEQTAAFWQGVDEQVLPLEVRRRLIENGLRVGLISGQLPAAIRDKLESTNDPIAALTAEQLLPGTEMLSRREQRHCRPGVSELIEILPQRPQRAVVLVQEQGFVRAEQFEQPSGFLALTAFTEGDGRVRLELIPGMEHGEPRQRVVGNQGAWRFDFRREQRLFDALGFSLPVTLGQTLVLTTTPEAKGLGGLLFADRFTSTTEQLFLLIRLSRAQPEDLFFPEDKSAPLVTPLE